MPGEPHNIIVFIIVTTRVLMLTMYDTDLTLIRLLQAGVRGFLKKDVHPDKLKFAIRSVMESGYYYSHTQPASW